MQPQLLTVIKKETLKTWTSEEWKRWWIEPKYDGYRLTYFQGKFLSRTGKPFHNLEHIAEELKGIDWMLDGEVYGENWEEAANARRSKSGSNVKLKFAVFDGMGEAFWERQVCPYNLRYRRAMVKGIAEGLKYVHVVPHFEGFNYLDFELLHTANLANGCDGTVLKQHDSMYEFKRTKTWLKVKPVEDFDAKVIGASQGEGKYSDTLGKLICLHNGVTFGLSGMTDAQRNLWWKHLDEPGHKHNLIGKTVEVQCRGFHKSGAPIEPRFYRLREDK